MTVSFYAKADNPVRLHVEMHGSKLQGDFDLDSTWKKFSVKLVREQESKIYMWLHSAGTAYINSIKLETGTVPTDWTPAPEDSYSDVMFARVNGSITGGGLVSVSTGGHIKWTQSFLAIYTKNKMYNPDGNFEISYPPVGTVIKNVSGSNDVTVTEDGIRIINFQALYYILPLDNQKYNSKPENFRIVDLSTTDIQIPSHWMLICIMNNTSNIYHFPMGLNLPLGSQGVACQSTAASSNTVAQRDANGNLCANNLFGSNLGAVDRPFKNGYIDRINSADVLANTVTAKNKFITDAGVHYYGKLNANPGVEGYYSAATITITNQYANYPIIVSILRRGTNVHLKGTILFKGVNGLDPDLYYFSTNCGNDKIYLFKSAASTWDLYVKKMEGYDTQGIDVFVAPVTNIKVEIKNEFVSTLPVGYYASTMQTKDINITGNASTASKLQTPRNIKIGDTAKEFDGSADITFTKEEIGVSGGSGSRTETILFNGTFIVDKVSGNNYGWSHPLELSENINEFDEFVISYYLRIYNSHSDSSRVFTTENMVKTFTCAGNSWTRSLSLDYNRQFSASDGNNDSVWCNDTSSLGFRVSNNGIVETKQLIFNTFYALEGTYADVPLDNTFGNVYYGEDYGYAPEIVVVRSIITDYLSPSGAKAFACAYVINKVIGIKY